MTVKEHEGEQCSPGFQGELYRIDFPEFTASWVYICPWETRLRFFTEKKDRLVKSGDRVLKLPDDREQIEEIISRIQGDPEPEESEARQKMRRTAVVLKKRFMRAAGQTKWLILLIMADLLLLIAAGIHFSLGRNPFLVIVYLIMALTVLAAGMFLAVIWTRVATVLGQLSSEELWDLTSHQAENLIRSQLSGLL